MSEHESDITADPLTPLVQQRRMDDLFRSLIENSLDIITIINTEGVICYISSSVQPILGYQQVELIGVNMTTLLHPEDLPKVQAMIEAITPPNKTPEITQVIEVRFCHKDGSWRIMEGISKILDISSVTSIVINYRDITKHKQTEHYHRLEAKRLESSIALNNMIDQGEQAVLDFILEECISISESRYAFIGQFDAEESVMTMIATQEDTMAQCTVYNPSPIFTVAEAGLWAEPIRQRRPVFINDFTAPYQHKHGTPAGHFKLTRYLGVPIIDRGRIVLMIAVANKETEYSQSDVDRLNNLITEAWIVIQRSQAESNLLRSNRALKTLSTCNQALVRAKNEPELLNAVCQTIVEKGGYYMAWVGYADNDPQQSITPQCWIGIEDAFMLGLKLTWADTERGQGPCARAIRCGEPQFSYDNILSDPEFAPWREQALSQGYISAFACPLWINHRIIGSLAIYATEAFTADERVLLEQLAHDLAFGIETLRTRGERDRLAEDQQQHARLLQKSLEQSIQAIIDTVEKRDPYISGHQHRVGVLSASIAQEMGLAEEQVHGIRLAAAVHDLGKIQVPAEILSKPGKLSDIELMLIKTHPQAGYDILKDVDFPWPIATMVWQHHERMDGSGYPQGLKGDEILLESRILAVADVIEAMASHRPYRASLGIEVALAEIERGRGSAYDPMVVDICLKLFREGRFTFPE
ncbi:MAG: hypothetical protein RLZZ419_895 [Pseudomonadota bacterium]|jgi:PAS domain S-box-containing protein